MQQFSIRDIENLCGIKAHTLRIWEQRYGLSLSKRKVSLRRYYDNEDLKQLLRIAYLYHHGYKISCIASMNKEEILDLAKKGREPGEFESFVNQMIEASLDFDSDQLESIAHQAVVQLGLVKALNQIFYPFLEKIGLLWMTNHAVPAQEHFSSHIISKKIIREIDRLPNKAQHYRKKILLFSPPGEYHEIPLLFILYLFKKSGHLPIYLGTNINFQCLEYICNEKKVENLYLHLITNFTNCPPEDYLIKLAKILPGRKIIASGPAFQNIIGAPIEITLLHSQEEIQNFILNF
jgi:MerR family transcriptional regulator, light-induced transcriptional regulator